MRVFYSNATKYANQSFQHFFALNKNEKKTKRNKRLLKVEQTSFTPLVSSAKGGIGSECKKSCSVLAEIIATKRKQEYCITMSWLRRKITFSLMGSFCYSYVVVVERI